ncbi:MAG: DUF4139 domain-containing protein, partial [Acidobacteriaceae bacterium]|nr:DUF4139 domain-containing protein [Acidobacteriaceae bacterium]
MFSLSLAFPSVAQTAQTPRPESKPEKSASLPVTRVALYKNGVGYFEHSGTVTGNQSVTIDFTTGQLNDVLQSLTAIDLNGGRITGAGYNSTTPLEQQLQALPIALGDDASTADLYAAIRGANVEVTGTGAAFTGRILNMEVRSTSATKDAPAAERRFLTVVSDSGAVRTFELTSGVAVRLLDSTLHADLTRYLEVIANNRSQGLRHLTLTDSGTGTRQLRVSYISEVPIWKSTYRVLLTSKQAGAPESATLQGWAVVDNTVGTDWNSVQLSLIAGSPQSFIQPLSQPIYSRRPEVPIAQEAQLTPQTHESGEDAKQEVAGVAGMSMGNGSGAGMMAEMAPAPAMKARSLHAQVMVSPSAPAIEYEDAANNSIAPNTSTSAYDNYFEYKLTDPVTIRKNESALVPIFQTKIPIEQVTIWSASNEDDAPLRALWLTNSSSLTIDRGSFSIVENGNFSGQGLLDPIHPDEKRLLSYAADQAVRVIADKSNDSQRILSITVNKGVLREQTSQLAEVEYTVRNSSADPRTVIVEHPIHEGWKLDSETQPAETTSGLYRFRVAVQPGTSASLQVKERRNFAQVYRLIDTNDSQLTLILQNAKASPA